MGNLKVRKIVLFSKKKKKKKKKKEKTNQERMPEWKTSMTLQWSLKTVRNRMRHVENLPDRHTKKKSLLLLFIDPKNPL